MTLESAWLTPLGRADAHVKILGELVDPEAIERELLAISKGLLAPGTFAVIPIPDERAGNVLVPVFDSSVSPAVIANVLFHYEAHAPGFRRLRPAAVIGEFPRGKLGKLRRAELTALYQRSIPRNGTPPT